MDLYQKVLLRLLLFHILSSLLIVSGDVYYFSLSHLSNCSIYKNMHVPSVHNSKIKRYRYIRDSRSIQPSKR